MYEFKLADLGEGMHEAEVVQWLIKEGDTTRLDQTIAKVETDKAMVELPSPIAGRVSEIRVKDGQVARVGDVLVVFETSTPAAGTVESTAKNTETDVTNSAASVPAAAPSSVPSSQAATTATKPRVLAAPAVRKLAFELGIDLEQVTPSNTNGRVSLEDVRAYAERAKAEPAPAPTQAEQPVPQPLPAAEQKVEQAVPTRQDERQPLTGLRKRIAEHMERSWRTVPHATAFDEIDGSALIALRQALKPVAEQRGVRLTYMPLLVKLLVPVLKEFPIFNGSLAAEKREIIY